MKQKVFAIALAALLTICCTGCGKKNEEMTSSADLAKSASHDDAHSGVTNGASLTPESPEAAPEAAAEEAEAYDGGAWDDAADADYAFDAKLEGAMSPAAVSGDRSFSAAEGAVEGEGPAEYDIPDDVIDIAPEEPVIIEPDVRAGLLTAGRWRDHDNWGFFSNLVNNDTIAFPSFGIDPTQRIAVKVTNSAGEALPNAKVVLTQDGTPVWSAVSGKGRHGISITVSGSEADIGQLVRCCVSGVKNNTLMGERLGNEES